MSQNTSAASQNTNLSIATGTNILYRVLLQATGDPAIFPPALRFQKNGSGGYAQVATSATTTYPVPVLSSIGTMVSGTGAVTVVVPPHSLGDLLVILVETANQAVATAPASPFAGLSVSPEGTGTAAGTTATRLTGYACISNGSEAASYNIGDAGDHTAAVCLAFAGTHQTYASAIHQIAGSVAASASTSVTFDAVTTTVDNCLIVNIVSNATDTTTAQASGWTNASLTSLAERFDQNVTAGNGGGISVATGTLATAGASGATTATLATSSVQGKFTIALRPPAPVTNEIYVSNSTNISDGEATTQRMSGGTGSFDAGKIWDASNNSGTINLGSNNNSEIEWCVKLSASLSGGDYFDLETYNDVGALDSYTATGRLTIAGGGYSMPADYGTYALTGKASGLLSSRKVTASQGSYSLTGQSAALLRLYSLVSAQGTYSLSGQTVLFPRTRVLAAAQGAYALAGQGAATLYGRRVLAAQGTYSLSGQSSGLSALRLLAAGYGNYALSGIDATLDYGGTAPVLVAGAGSYTLSGQSASLGAARSITAAQGAYALGGQTAGLLYLRSLSGATGSYALTGQAAVLSRAATLPATRGAYSLTGTTAGLIWSGGSYTLSYSGTKIPVYEVSSSGRVRWVDYIPVTYYSLTEAQVNRYNDDGGFAVSTLVTPVGREWEHYIPVVPVVSTEYFRWRYDDAGFIPVVEAEDP